MERRVRFAVVFVVLLCVLAAGSSFGRKRKEKLNLFLKDAAPPDVAINTEQIWMTCRLDLMSVKGIFEGLDWHLPEEMPIGPKEMDSTVWPMTKENLEETISLLPPQMKQTLLDCLRKNNIPFSVSGKEDDFKIWFIKYLETLFNWPTTSKRYLGEKLVEAPAPGPGPAPAPSLVPAPAPAPAPASVVQPPNYAPEPASDHAFDGHDDPADSLTESVIEPDSSSKRPSGGAKSSKKQHSARHSPSKKHHSHAPSAVSIGVAAAGTFLFVALLFYCCHRCRKRSYSGYGLKDDRPLLTLSLSDFSVDSSQKSSSNSKKFGSLSFGTHSIENGKAFPFHSNLESGVQHSSIAKTPSLGASAGAAKASVESSGNIGAAVPPPPPLKLPPGRVAPPPPGPPPPPPIPSGIKPGPGPPPPPPPPPKGAPAPPRAPQPFSRNSKLPKPPLGPKHSGNSISGEGTGEMADTDGPKTKLKPFFWDKVLANPDQSMVWHEISSGSFQFNEEMIENLFGYAGANKNKNENKKDLSSKDPSAQFIQIIDSKKAQNLSILLRALNVTTEEVCDALQEGNELPVELLQTLLKMAPTVDEELKLRLYSGELSQLGPAERFLKVLVEIPFAFKRMDLLLFKSSLQEEISGLKESLTTLEAACKELRSSRLFLKLLEAVLKTGNRMNSGTYRGGAQAFKLDTLLKLSDVKGTDGKTTLLHFVVQEIIRSEGVRAARALRESDSFSSVKSEDFHDDCSPKTGVDYRILGLQVVSRLGADLENVRKASVLDADSITNTVSKLGHALVKSRDFLNSEMQSEEEDSGFYCTIKSLVEHAEVDITKLLKQEKRIFTLVKSTVDYFHGSAGKDEGLRLFVIVRDFLIMLDKACKEVEISTKMAARMSRNRESPRVPPADQRRPFNSDSLESSVRDLRQRLFPAIKDRRMDESSSDDDSLSP